MGIKEFVRVTYIVRYNEMCNFNKGFLIVLKLHIYKSIIHFTALI